MTKILLADHYSLFRAGMVELIHSIGGFTVAGEVDSAESAVEFTAKHTPDILLLEMSMPGMSGFEALRRIQRLHVGTRVVALTHWTNHPYHCRLCVRAIGYLGKDITEEFATALHKSLWATLYFREHRARSGSGCIRTIRQSLSDYRFAKHKLCWSWAANLLRQLPRCTYRPKQ